jgi:hypothetical protein
VVSNLVSNALESHTQVFPILTEAQINRIRPFASLRHVSDGAVLFRADGHREAGPVMATRAFSVHA